MKKEKYNYKILFRKVEEAMKSEPSINKKEMEEMEEINKLRKIVYDLNKQERRECSST